MKQCMELNAKNSNLLDFPYFSILTHKNIVKL